jgi:tetrahydromethanopterin:alpha-L-glutamate ligase
VTDLNIAVVGLPGNWSTETLADAVEQKTGSRLVVDMSEVWLDLHSRELRYKDHNLCDFDALIIKKVGAHYCPDTLDRLEMLRVAERAGVRVFNPATNTIRLVDRLSCTVTLRNHSIPMPHTCIVRDVAAALNTIQGYGCAIFKPLYSTKARGMEVIESTEPENIQREKVQTFLAHNPTMYIQKKLDLPGQDLGMVFLGGEYLGAYARVSRPGSWNTTILSGGKYQAYTATADLIDLAYRAQKPFGMDFTTVDVAESESGPVVFEVSAFGGFRGLKDGTGLDAASLYSDYVIKTLKRGAG